MEAESGDEVFTVEASQIILSSGAIASPQVLLLSGVGPSQQIQGLGIELVQPVPALTYLGPARHRLNLTTRGNVTVRRILFQGKKAVGVEAESGEEVFTVEAGQIILSSGAIASPQVLLLSGVGPSQQIQGLGIELVHDLPGVGENLRDHSSLPQVAQLS